MKEGEDPGPRSLPSDWAPFASRGGFPPLSADLSRFGAKHDLSNSRMYRAGRQRGGQKGQCYSVIMAHFGLIYPRSFRNFVEYS